MKKRISLILTLALLFAAAGCGNNSSAGRTENQSAGVNDVLEAGVAEAEGKNGSGSQSSGASGKTEGNGQSAAATGETAGGGQSPAADAGNKENAEGGRQSGVNEGAPAPENAGGAAAAAGGTEGIDIDLTLLSSTMVYSEVYNMMASPEDYVGKTVKMDGKFAIYYDKVNDKNYYSCIISDATACCSQGIEFILTDDYTYPDDYPESGSEICVMGVFDLYEEGKYTYATLRDAVIA